MPSNPRSVLTALSALLAIMALPIAARLPSTAAAPPAATQPTTFAEILAGRPAPDLATLAARSTPKTTGKDSTESFYDLLKLRETKDPKAVPALTQIIESNARTNRIHGYAAGQALFMIGTPEAHKVLDKYLLDEDLYRADLIRLYAFGWEMPEPQRSQFIDQYVLKTTSKNLGLKLEAAKGDAPGEIKFTLTLKNASPKALSILEPQGNIARMLYVRGKVVYASQESGIREHALTQKWIQLQPGEEQPFETSATVQTAGPRRGKDRLATPDIKFILDVQGVRFYLAGEKARSEAEERLGAAMQRHAAAQSEMDKAQQRAAIAGDPTLATAAQQTLAQTQAEVAAARAALRQVETAAAQPRIQPAQNDISSASHPRARGVPAPGAPGAPGSRESRGGDRPARGV